MTTPEDEVSDTTILNRVTRLLCIGLAVYRHRMPIKVTNDNVKRHNDEASDNSDVSNITFAPSSDVVAEAEAFNAFCIHGE